MRAEEEEAHRRWAGTTPGLWAAGAQREAARAASGLDSAVGVAVAVEGHSRRCSLVAGVVVAAAEEAGCAVAAGEGACSWGRQRRAVVLLGSAAVVEEGAVD